MCAPSSIGAQNICPVITLAHGLSQLRSHPPLSLNTRGRVWQCERFEAFRYPEVERVLGPRRSCGIDAARQSFYAWFSGRRGRRCRKEGLAWAAAGPGEICNWLQPGQHPTPQLLKLTRAANRGLDGGWMPLLHGRRRQSGCQDAEGVAGRLKPGAASVSLGARHWRSARQYPECSCGK